MGDGYLKAALVVVPLAVFLWWADQHVAHAAVWALLLLSVSTGFVHGALDAVLMLQRYALRWQVALVFVAYLMLVVVLAWALSAAISLALWVLLLMSAWHFGEPYGRWPALARWQSGLTRAVVGGAPVMLPIWLAPEQLGAVLQTVLPTVALDGWLVGAAIWLGLLTVWVLVSGLEILGPRKPYPLSGLHYAGLEVLGCAALYAIFSPLMAFAIYFGVYHAPLHIWRVWCSCKAVRAVEEVGVVGLGEGGASLFSRVSATTAIMAIVATAVFSWLLGAALWWFLGTGTDAAADWGSALRWLIVAFAALTAPHLILISACNEFLTPAKD